MNKITPERIAQHRRTKKLLKAVEENLSKIESDLNNIIRERINEFRLNIRICEHCGIPFIAMRSTARFCSDICRTDHGRFES